jgi:hypothetical protein
VGGSVRPGAGFDVGFPGSRRCRTALAVPRAGRYSSDPPGRDRCCRSRRGTALCCSGGPSTSRHPGRAGPPHDQRAARRRTRCTRRINRRSRHNAPQFRLALAVRSPATKRGTPWQMPGRRSGSPAGWSTACHGVRDGLVAEMSAPVGSCRVVHRRAVSGSSMDC